MASWKTLSTYTYKDEAETTGSGAIKIKVQYDKDSMTHLETRCFRIREEARNTSLPFHSARGCPW